MRPTATPCLLALLLVGFWMTVADHPESSREAKSRDGCGTIAGLGCDEGLWCDYSAGQCGAPDAGGTCVRVPEICTQDYKPVCGCDGKTYGNDCERLRARVQKDKDGACPKK